MRGLSAAGLALVAMLSFGCAQAPAAAVPHYTVKIVKTFPHDPAAFTEGLFYDGGKLFESTGRNGSSWIREVDLDTGKVLRHADVDNRYFGEGIAAWQGKIVSLTWKGGTGFIWDKAQLKPTSTFSYTGEGWGMTVNDQNLLMSDGSPTIKFLDPNTLKVVRTLDVTLEGQPVDNINELEWVDGQILANIWRTRTMVRIDPQDGKVTGVIDLSNLPEVTTPQPDNDAVANGIAWDAGGKRLFLTGKLWPHLYQVELEPAPTP